MGVNVGPPPAKASVVGLELMDQGGMFTVLVRLSDGREIMTSEPPVTQLLQDAWAKADVEETTCLALAALATGDAYEPQLRESRAERRRKRRLERMAELTPSDFEEASLVPLDVDARALEAGIGVEVDADAALGSFAQAADALGQLGKAMGDAVVTAFSGGAQRSGRTGRSAPSEPLREKEKTARSTAPEPGRSAAGDRAFSWDDQ